MVSKPDFDPTRYRTRVIYPNLVSNCNDNPDRQGIFINRATQGLYTPGSTFKTVTLIAALDTGLVDTNTVFDFGEQVVGPNGRYYVYEVDGGIIPTRTMQSQS